MKFKEFTSENGPVDEQINKWIGDNSELFIVDTKYSANNFGSHVLIAYQRGERFCNTHIQK